MAWHPLGAEGEELVYAPGGCRQDEGAIEGGRGTAARNLGKRGLREATGPMLVTSARLRLMRASSPIPAPMKATPCSRRSRATRM